MLAQKQINATKIEDIPVGKVPLFALKAGAEPDAEMQVPSVTTRSRRRQTDQLENQIAI